MANIVLETVIAIVLICLAGLVIPWIKTKTTAVQQETLMKVLDVLVSAAEQLHGTEGDGERKLQLVESWLVDRGIDAPRVEIEAAVYRMNTGSNADNRSD
ncbi:hypothetical protein AGMMS49992_29100 [Clostridia bacterium]|nr:hypothetical protein AGMMS49992_29100 [Clostridia bacterium]